ncbi:Protein IQ-DOMAIN 1 [Dichanthelium oligosanthes]|uniref:Protein IQ-DOMAIN 1 n=1 Tax=Dichanthelium oligosanthes TaxID=888268 RepID=A0A1E5VVU7_9POAL|nr:Protein IQ-DOMAIN 1 [Dichanthelium oligosanthes]
MGRKVKWFDTVHRILSTSEPDPVETDAKKAAKLRDRPGFKKLWQFGKSNQSGASTSAAPAPALDPPEAHQPQPPPSPRPDQQQAEETTAEAQHAETRRDDGDVRPADVASNASADDDAAEAATVGRPTVTTPTVWTARSKEDIAATRIQAACRGYLARRGHQERGVARLMSLVEGFTIKRQTEEALYCMQTMTRIQTQIYARRLKTEEDKKALKGQIKVKQSLDKIKVGEGWDHSLQSKEQMEAVMTMKQEAASRRQRALSYAFSNQWRNRNPPSARAAPAPMFMDPGNPNWGWSWTERWMAAARPWENQTAAPDNGRAAAKSAGRMPRLAVSVQIPTTTPKGRSFRPPNWPSLPSPSTPPPRSPSLSGRMAVPGSPRSSSLHTASGLHRTKSMQPERRPRSSQERSVMSSQDLSVSSPRRAVPASPRGGGSGSPLHASSGLQRTKSMLPDWRPRSSQERLVMSNQEVSASSPRRAVPSSPRGSGSGSPLHASSGTQPERRPRSSQERAVSSPRLGAKEAPLRRTTSLRAELPRRLSLGSATISVTTAAGDDAGAPVTPSYMHSTKSVKAKARCASPSASAAADAFDAPESVPAPLQPPSPSSAKKRLPLAFADKPSVSSPGKVVAERARRHSQPPSPRMSLA